ncbi:MAG: cytochrome c-type biogenesis protein CcmF, partial [Paracoccaceae bacterium]
YRAKLGRARFGEVLRRLWNFPRADWGKTLAHMGFGVTVFGISALMAWEVEKIGAMQVGDTAELGGYAFRFDKVEAVQGPNWTAQVGTFTAFAGEEEVGQMQAEKRFYPVQRIPTTEAGLDQGLTRDLYVVLGDKQDGIAEAYAVRIYVKPFAAWIWLGCLIMGLGGLASLSDRRWRVGAAAKRPVAAATTATPTPTAAE